VNNANKERKVRAISNMLKDIEVNQALWSLTDAMLPVPKQGKEDVVSV